MQKRHHVPFATPGHRFAFRAFVHVGNSYVQGKFARLQYVGHVGPILSQLRAKPRTLPFAARPSGRNGRERARVFSQLVVSLITEATV